MTRHFVLLAGDPSRFDQALAATRDAAIARGDNPAAVERAVMRERHAHYQCGRRSAVIGHHHDTGRFYVRAMRDGAERPAVLADAALDGTFADAVVFGVLWAAEEPETRALYATAEAMRFHRTLVAHTIARGAA